MKSNKKLIKVICCSLLFAFLPLFFGIFFLTSPAHAITEAAVMFLLFEPGARANGMGGSFTGIADDATAIFYNPAGLTQMKLVSAEYNRMQWLPSLTGDMTQKYAAATFTHPSAGSFGIGFKIFDLGELQGMDEFGNETMKFRSYEYALSFTYLNDTLVQD
ncbi:PorV/PorQ family protein [candidate division KSB1 bacterium]|nr:PorV/PorQ family protein [candidate division KSB1 bacterium]